MNKRLGGIARWLLTVAILAYLFGYKVDARPMWETICGVNWLWFSAALAFYGLNIVGGIVRWRFLLRAQSIRIPTPRVTVLFFIGLFFNSFLPTGTGGDVVRAYYATREAPAHKPEVVMTILMDRLMGLLGLFSITLVMIVTHAGWIWERPGLRWPSLLVVGLMVAALVGLALTLRPSRNGRGSWLARKAQASRFAEQFHRAVESYRSYAGHTRALGWAMIVSVLLHLANLAAGVCIGASLGIEGVDWVKYFLLVPIVNTIASLPITVSGIGVREEMYRRTLAELGVASEPSVALGLLSYAMQLAWSLVGGVVYLLWKPERHLLAHAEDSH